MNDKISKTILIRNKRAEFDYYFLQKLTAGLVLTGTEIKSIRTGKASLADTYCIITRHEVWVKGMYVAPYFYGSFSNTGERRDRKLLLNRREIRKLETEIKNPGLTIVPTKLFIDDKGRAKLEIALARGKKQYDKREVLKEKNDRREMDRAMKSYKR